MSRRKRLHSRGKEHMPDEIEVPIEVDAATYAYLLKQAAPRPKREGSRRKQLAKRAEDPTITQARQQMKAAVLHFLTAEATKTAAAFLGSEKLAKGKDEELPALLADPLSTMSPMVDFCGGGKSMWAENNFIASVGKYGPTSRQCYNTVRDQQIIMDLLNAIPEKRGGAGGTLTGPIPWGVVSEDLYKAIFAFQRAHTTEGLSVDGHVDPHQKMIRLLLQLAKEYSTIKADIVPLGPLFISPDVSPFGRSLDWDDNPNLTLASDEFRIKMLAGVSFGEGIGFTTVTFAIWDVKNNRAAAYNYTNVIATLGSAVNLTDNEGAWSKPFTTPKWLQVDQFDGRAEHDAVGALIWGAIVLRFRDGVSNPFSGGFTVDVASGFSKGFGIEGSKQPGYFTLVPGSVKVFKGP